MRNSICAVILFPVVYVLLSVFLRGIYIIDISSLRNTGIHIKEFHSISSKTHGDTTTSQNPERIEVSLIDYCKSISYPSTSPEH